MSSAPPPSSSSSSSSSNVPVRGLLLQVPEAAASAAARLQARCKPGACTTPSLHAAGPEGVQRQGQVVLGAVAHHV